MRQALPVLAAAALALAGCTALDPFDTAPRPATAAQHDAGPRVAICSNRLVSSSADVRGAAQGQCPAHTVATLVATDWHLDFCPLLLPARSTFVCSPVK